MKKYTCTYCEKIYISKYKPKGNCYCSKSCSNFHIKRRKPEHKCKNCDNLVNNRRRYCSEECKQMFHNINKTPTHIIKDKRVKSVISFRQRLKIKCVEYKGGKCSICEYDKCIQALEFHHLDPNEKDFQISGKSLKWNTIVKELDKCIILCSNCHREVHNNILILIH